MSMPTILIKVHNYNFEFRFVGNSILQCAPVELLYELYREGEVTCGREYAISQYMVLDSLGIQETIASHDRDQEYYLVTLLSKDSYKTWFQEAYPAYTHHDLPYPLSRRNVDSLSITLAGMMEVLLVDKDSSGRTFLNKCKLIDAEHLNKLRTQAISLIPSNLFRDED